MRKFTVFAYLEMIEMEDRIYKNKFAVKAALGMIRALKKIDRIKEEENKKNEIELAEYQKTKEFEKLQ